MEINSEGLIRLQKIRTDIDALLATSPVKIATCAQKASNRQGVYVVTDEADDEVLYAGKSDRNKDGVNGRVYDHLHVKGSGNLCDRLPGGVAAVGRQLVRTVEIDDKTERRDLENALIAVLHPKYNK